MRSIICVLVLGIAACGGSPAAPSDTTPPPATSLLPGRYAFAVVMASNGQPGLQPPCLISGAGNPSGTIPEPTSGFVVTAVSDGAGGLTLRPESRVRPRLDDDLAALGVGRRRDAARYGARLLFSQIVTIDNGASQAPATLTGAFGYTHNFVGGQVGGRVVFERGGWTYACPYNDWIMNRLF